MFSTVEVCLQILSRKNYICVLCIGIILDK
jgi:hypothetical protein